MGGRGESLADAVRVGRSGGLRQSAVFGGARVAMGVGKAAARWGRVADGRMRGGLARPACNAYEHRPPP